MIEKLKKFLKEQGIEVPEDVSKDAIIDIIYSLLNIDEQSGDKKNNESENNESKNNESKNNETEKAEAMGVS